jgi:hypothetical protein
MAAVGAPVSATTWYYQRRVAAQSQRKVNTWHVPAVVGFQTRPSNDDKLFLRRDILGPLLRDHEPVVPVATRANLLAAVDKRANYHTSARCHSSITSASKNLLDRIAPDAWDPITVSTTEFLEWNSQFPAAKQARHLKVWPMVSDITTKSFSAKQIFVKVEALLKRHDPNWAPRIIYQSSDIHNVILGPYMQKCCKRMFSALKLGNTSESNNYLGAYGATTEELVSFINRAGGDSTVYIESDFSSNDMTQVQDVSLLEIMWLRRFGAPLWVTGLLLHANSFNAVSHKYGVRVRVTNQLATGAQSTTFRNTLWNMTINHAFCLRVGAHMDSLVLGDDNTARYDNPFSSKAKNIRREYEHVCKLACMDAEVKVVKFLSQTTFLSKHFIPTATSYVMVPKLGKAVGRFNARASANEAVSDEAYLAGKALSYSYEFRHCPPISRMFMMKFERLCPDGVLSLDGISWNAKDAFVRYGVSGVLDRIKSVCAVCTRDDMNVFYYSMYSMTASDVIDLVMAVLFRHDDIDEAMCLRVLEDFE